MLLSYTESWLSHNMVYYKFSVMSRNQVWNPFEITFYYHICITYTVITYNKCGPEVKKDKFFFNGLIHTTLFYKTVLHIAKWKDWLWNASH